MGLLSAGSSLRRSGVTYQVEGWNAETEHLPGEEEFPNDLTGEAEGTARPEEPREGLERIQFFAELAARVDSFRLRTKIGRILDTSRRTQVDRRLPSGRLPEVSGESVRESGHDCRSGDQEVEDHEEGYRAGPSAIEELGGRSQRLNARMPSFTKADLALGKVWGTGVQRQGWQRGGQRGNHFVDPGRRGPPRHRPLLTGGLAWSAGTGR